MKWIFLNMLLVNLCFAAWAVHLKTVEEPLSRKEVTLPGHVNRLLLLSELDDTP